MPGSTIENLQIPATLRPSRAKRVWLFVGSLLFVLGGIWMIREGQRTGYFVTGVFSICLAVAVILFIPGAAWLRLTADGFTFCSLFRTQTVRWVQVREFSIIRVNIPMVAWNFTDDCPPPGRARRFAKWLWGYEAALPDAYGIKPLELLEVMETLRQRYGQTGNA